MAEGAEDNRAKALHIAYRPLSQGERIFDDAEQGRQWDMLHARLELRSWGDLGPLGDVIYFNLTLRLL